jgi:hypothetical protein
MINTIVPLCYYCKHYRIGVDDGEKRMVTCEAYPNGIPSRILYELGDHRMPFSGYNGIQFEPSVLSRTIDILEWDQMREELFGEYRVGAP